MYARIAWILTVAGAFLLSAATADAARFSLVEARPAARPFLTLTGAKLLDSGIGLWRVPTTQVRHLRRAGLIRLAEPDRRFVPDVEAADPLLPQEWWFRVVGASSVVAPGPGVPVAVVDTGLDFSHPEFEARDNTTSLNTQSVVNTNSDFHGTSVASVIGAPVNGVGMVGVYPQAVLYSYDADLSGAITAGDLIEGIATAARLGRVVINLSLGSPRFDRALEDAVYSAYRGGALVVAASGNSGAGSVPNYPADFPHVMTVGATDESGFAAVFSSSADAVDLAAPGVDIPAAVPFLYSSDGYQLVDGTSFSAPIVSGAAALIWTVRRTLDNTQLSDVLRLSARDISTHGFDPETGFGMLDIPGALAREAPARDPGEPNDDVRLVKPGGLFAAGWAPLTTPAKPKASIRASVEVSEDPVDLYRLWVPGRSSVTIGVHSDAVLQVNLWRPATRSVTERGTAAKRDLAASGATRVRTVNTSRRGGYYYAEVRAAPDAVEGFYTLRVTTGATATP